MEGLWDIPQFAYRKKSSTIDALLRGSLHCTEVRSLAGEVNTDVATRLTTGDLPVITGGLMISLDLAKAFNCMPFGVMYESWREVGVSDPMARLVVETHKQSTCIVRHCGHSVRVGMKRGLRQGCPLCSLRGLSGYAGGWGRIGAESTLVTLVFLRMMCMDIGLSEPVSISMKPERVHSNSLKSCIDLG